MRGYKKLFFINRISLKRTRKGNKNYGMGI